MKEKTSETNLYTRGRAQRAKRYSVLVATNGAGRGIDIPGGAHVFNCDMPGNIEVCTPRMGRAGRAGKMAIATTFLTWGDTKAFPNLKQVLIQGSGPVPPEFWTRDAPSDS